jgi:hypothetical protein
MSQRVPLSVKRELVDKVDAISRAEGIAIKDACEKSGLKKDRYYEYKRIIERIPDAVSSSALASSPGHELVKSKGIGDHERISIPISRENYNLVEAIAKRKAMPLSSFCAGLLDEKITELREASN